MCQFSESGKWLDILSVFIFEKSTLNIFTSYMQKYVILSHVLVNWVKHEIYSLDLDLKYIMLLIRIFFFYYCNFAMILLEGLLDNL